PRQQAHGATELKKPDADLADRAAIILAEVSDRLVVGSKAARQPHHFNIAQSLALKPPARLNPIKVAVDVELQQDRWMIARPASCLGSNPVKSQFRQIKLINKDIDHPNRIVLIDPVFQAIGKKCALLAIRALNEALHPPPRQPRISAARITRRRAFSHSQGQTRSCGHGGSNVRFARKGPTVPTLQSCDCSHSLNGYYGISIFGHQ